MIIILRAILISIILITSIGFMPTTSAGINITNIEVHDIKNGRARVKWDTPSEVTKAIVYYGDSADDLSKFIGYGVFDKRHETFMSGLNKDETYYFKIVAISRLQEKTESFVQTFSTKDMLDTILPHLNMVLCDVSMELGLPEPVEPDLQSIPALFDLFARQRKAAREDQQAGIISVEEAREEGGYPKEVNGELLIDPRFISL